MGEFAAVSFKACSMGEELAEDAGKIMKVKAAMEKRYFLSSSKIQKNLFFKYAKKNLLHTATIKSIRQQ